MDKYNRRKLQQSEYRSLNKVAITKRRKERYLLNRDEISRRNRIKNNLRYWNNDAWRINKLQKQRVSRLVRKAKLIQMYGGKCKCCGEYRIGFLTVEHVGGGGKASRYRDSSEGHITWLLAKKRPKIAVLCYDCNCPTGALGYCPHKHKHRISSMTCDQILLLDGKTIARRVFNAIRGRNG